MADYLQNGGLPPQHLMHTSYYLGFRLPSLGILAGYHNPTYFGRGVHSVLDGKLTWMERLPLRKRSLIVSAFAYLS